jgi:protein SCO1/2
MGLMVIGVVGCKKESVPAKTAALQYPLHGTIVATDAKDNEVSVDGEAIPGFMDAMTMSYKLATPSSITELHPGDKIFATLDCDGNGDDCTNMQLADIVITAQAKADYVPAMQYHVPTPGDVVPNFVFLNQSDKKIDLKQFKGKVLLMTFIYTRCPLADYCPRMSHNFAHIDKDLSADKKLYGETHLLTVSFDPTYDTPKVLKSYGEAYTGQYSNATFKHWDFAAPEIPEMKKIKEYFALGVTPGQNGTLQHSLSTLVIGKDGKVVAFWPTRDWKISDVEAVMQKAAAAK